MITNTLPPPIVPGVPIVRTPQAVRLLRRALTDSSGDLVVLGLQVRESQRRMLQDLSYETKESQAALLRGLIDEWCASHIAAADREQNGDVPEAA